MASIERFLLYGGRFLRITKPVHTGSHGNREGWGGALLGVHSRLLIATSTHSLLGAPAYICPERKWQKKVSSPLSVDS